MSPLPPPPPPGSHFTADGPQRSSNMTPSPPTAKVIVRVIAKAVPLTYPASTPGSQSSTLSSDPKPNHRLHQCRKELSSKCTSKYSKSAGRTTANSTPCVKQTRIGRLKSILPLTLLNLLLLPILFLPLLLPLFLRLVEDQRGRLIERQGM